MDNCGLCFHLVFDDETKFPKVLKSINIDDEFHVQLQFSGMSLRLPQRFVQGHYETLKKVSYLENVPAYIRNTATNNYNGFLNELNRRNFYNPQSRPPYSA